MSHTNQDQRDKTNINYQVKKRLNEMCCFGRSKHIDKLICITSDKIYSFKTLESYEKAALRFAKWVKSTHGCTDLESAYKYAAEYIQMRNNSDLSAYTVKLDACALGKLYEVPSTTFGETRSRRRRDIKRSRGEAQRDKHFSLENNKAIIEFAKATGLRRSELEKVRGCDLNEDGTIHVVGKGGRHRDVIIIGPYQDQIRKWMKEMDNKLLWEKVPGKMDVHGYRSEYATDFYDQIARKKRDIPPEERYCCRGDLKGVWYDKKAMLTVSRSLGHNRINVIAGHYLKAS